MYTGQSASPLTADAGGSPSAQLGLAEFSNGNFLGDRHLYADYYSTDSIKYYPYPRKAGTNYKQVRTHPSSSTDTFILKNRQQYTGIYYKKIADGITMDHHSRLTFLQTKFPDAPVVHSTTIRDPNVLSNYHNILIPKAVAYSAGVLDYFFRGKLDVSVSWNDGNGNYDLGITNLSGQDLKGGEFRLYWDDSSNDRTRLMNPGSSTEGRFIIAWDDNSSLPDGQTVNATFNPPTCSRVKRYTLIYRGKIGTVSGQALDPIDDGIAIAAKRFEPLALDCEGGTGDAPDYYSIPIPP
jgi:hypothetical protein